ncbi:hypothetical protein NDU88_010156 [Pleurodeles waltl]|uniref:Uncharacterized protein n=1 Tax=Pleurodeles waltl TaxID=8319 RepID=A0AAV7PY02_PLEWA|nr:hypothetical protein NDU88_010156 [Pleurodeles waltl]
MVLCHPLGTGAVAQAASLAWTRSSSHSYAWVSRGQGPLLAADKRGERSFPGCPVHSLPDIPVRAPTAPATTHARLRGGRESQQLLSSSESDGTRDTLRKGDSCVSVVAPDTRGRGPGHSSANGALLTQLQELRATRRP